MKYLNRLLLTVASAAFFIAGSASAQNPGTVTSHAFAVGKGAGTQGFSSVPCTSTQIPIGQSSADPSCKTLSGDVTNDANGVTAIGANKVTNAQFRQSGALSLVGRSANSTGNVADIQATAGSSCLFMESSSSLTCAALSAAQLPSGVDSNTLLAKTANYTIANTDCGKTIQAGAGSTGLFTITLPAVSGFSSNCVVTVLNGDTGRGKKLSGFPTTMTSSSMLWPSQGVTVEIVNGAWAVPKDPGRWKIPNNTTVSVDAINGNDANDCLATGTGNACQSLNQAVRVNIKDYFDLSGISSFPTALVTVQLADNQTTTGNCTTCYSTAHIAFNPVSNEGRNTILIQGNASTPGNTVISDASGSGIGVFGGVNVEVRNLQIGQTNCANSPKANSGFSASDSSHMRLEGGIVIGCVTNAQLQADTGGQLISDGAISVTAGGANLIFTDTGGLVGLNSQTVTFSNSPAYSQQTVSALGLSNVQVGAVTWTNGGTVTGTKFFCRANSVIETDTGSGASIPGSVAGTAANGCTVF